MYCDNEDCRVQSFMPAPAHDGRRPIDCPACGVDGITESELIASVEKKIGRKL